MQTLIHTIRHTASLCLCCALLAISHISHAAETVQLQVNLATPVMQANQAGEAFLKVALTGLKQTNSQQRIPANVSIVLDRSGSMDGEKLTQAKEAAIMAIQTLSEKDIISVVTYDSVVNVIVPATKATDKQAIINQIRGIRSGGSTALFAGVSKGAHEVRKFLDHNKVNRVILLSDGLANVGPQSPDELGQLGMSLGKEGISVTTIGLGLGYNEDLMTKLAGYSDGNHTFVEHANDLPRIFGYEFGDVLSVIAQDVEIEIICQDGVKPLEIIGRDGDIIGRKVKTRLNQLYSAQEKYLILKVQVPAQPAEAQLTLADVQVHYNDVLLSSQQQLSAQATAQFTQSEAVVKQSIDKETYEDTVQQVATQYKQKAIQLRDEGKKEQAIDVLNQASDYLRSNADSLGSSMLQDEVMELEEQTQSFDDDAEWNRQRKSIKSEVHKKNRQQSY